MTRPNWNDAQIGPKIFVSAFRKQHDIVIACISLTLDGSTAELYRIILVTHGYVAGLYSSSELLLLFSHHWAR